MIRFFTAFLLLLLTVCNSFSAFSWNGQNHPDRTNATTTSIGNRLRVVPNSIINPGGSSSLPLGPFYNASMPGDPVGAYWVGTGNTVVLQNGISRLELWQQTTSGYYLSQYIIVNRDGCPLAQIDAWSVDTENRSRTRGDVAWSVVVHVAKHAVVFTRSVPAPAVETTLEEVPITLNWSANVGDFSGTASMNSMTAGVYSGGGFNKVLTVSGSDLAHQVWSYVSTEVANPSLVSYGLSAVVNGIATTLATTSITITPKTTATITGPSVYTGDPLSISNHTFTIHNIYPEARCVLVLERPDGTNAVVWDSTDIGNTSSVTTVSASQSLNIGSKITDSGTYKFHLYQKAPILTDSVMLPSEVSSLTTSIPGGWEQVDTGLDSITISLKIEVKANIFTQH